MKIAITSSAEFNLLLDALADEIINACAYNRLYLDLLDSIPEYGNEMNHSPSFWHLTLISLSDSRILRLCRIYDQNAKSLNLVTLLHTIQDNLYLFDTDDFRERLKDNPFVESLASHPRKPDAKTLQEHLDFSSSRNPLVRKLMIWRNTIIAHRGAAFSLGKKDILINNPIPPDEMEALLNHAFEIFNHYSSLFRASTWAQHMVGQDDYKSCLTLLRLGLQKYGENLDKERDAILKIMKPPAE